MPQTNLKTYACCGYKCKRCDKAYNVLVSISCNALESLVVGELQLDAALCVAVDDVETNGVDKELVLDPVFLPVSRSRN